MKFNMNKKGDAMVLVVCIMAIILTLCLTMTASVAVVHSAARAEVTSEESRILAVSLSKQIQAQIDDKPAEVDDGLWYYINYRIQKYVEPDKVPDVNIKPWTYYNIDERGHSSNLAYKTFKFTELSPQLTEKFGEIQDVRVEMFWECDNESISTYDAIELTVNVTCVVRGQTCTISSVYALDGDSDMNNWDWGLKERS